MILGTKEIGQNISWVIFYRNMCQPDHTCSYSFHNPMISNIIVFLLEVAIENIENSHHTLIIYQHLGWSINGNPNYSELVAYCHGQFRENYHVHQL